ncbi:putative agc protein kinase protein [Phaeoacremonium minimum UCRPA7]|uniref:non-specific serine/threonine protein kinase n=1 Tax=Phaeoacremonium minimum (strain UCR-PA7) TaxID=1286976 RepID=R8BM71_PHAM7|nr:putative agc protein kinase protein [Phaeoacremonium minimum UCRPA7]EOO00478.1 putative agc protein kinase protein [Phaeoacremonium minimum UCRPA7]
MDQDPNRLAPPAVLSLRAQTAGVMERSLSEDIREEREELREAAEQTLNVIVDLNLDGTIRWVSPSWVDVLGTPSDTVQGTAIADIVVSEPTTIFTDVVESMQKDDSRSQFIRFSVKLGPLSKLLNFETIKEPEAEIESQVVDLEAQGIMVYDGASGGESHTMWMIRPWVAPREVQIDLNSEIVDSLGSGAEVLASYLTQLAESGVDDPANHAPPLPVLCRICERQIPPWWFEKHTDLCLQEHQAEMEVQMAQENLTEHRHAIVKVLDALEARKSRSISGDQPILPVAEYKGMPIGPTSTASSPGTGSPLPTSGRSGDRSGGLGHSRARSFAVRRPQARIVELLLDLCDTAIEISTPAIKESSSQNPGEFRTQSPQSESRISQVMQWQSPSTNTLEQEQGLAVLCADTERVAKAKVDAVSRHRKVIEYAERIRVEFAIRVQDCIDAAMRKAARIAAGQLSDSTGSESDDVEDEEEATPAQEQPFFTGSFDTPSSLAMALEKANISDDPDKRRLSAAIGKGAFGSVYLSKKKSTGEYFAIKVLKKADMVAKNQVTNVKAERAIMMWQGESDFVAKLYWTFSSKDYLYLVMEYLNGGDCASLIKVLGGLPEDWVKKYLGEVILGVEHLHSRGIVHRDLKPDNLLIDQKGHLKLTDFGLSRMGLVGRQKRALNSGTNEPVPDLLKTGPFAREAEQVFENILARRIHWPDDSEDEVSPEAKDLINKLLCMDPQQRFGSNRDEKFSSGGEEIRNHPWFQGMNWESLLEDEAQFVPQPENPEDTEYFDTRGATLQSFAEEMEDQASPPSVPVSDYPDRPHDALSRVRSQVNSIKRGLMPLHIPPHVRDLKSRRLSEPVVADDFGNFAFKNLPVLEKANKDVIQKLRAEALATQNKATAISPGGMNQVTSPGPTLEGSPVLSMPVQRTLSNAKASQRPQSPSGLSHANSSPSRVSQPSSPLLVSFVAGQGAEGRLSRMVMEKLLEKLRCRTISASTGSEAVRYSMSDIKFDIIFMEFKLPQINGADVARMIRETKNANSHTPIVAITAYLKELQAPHYFDSLVEKPISSSKLTEVLGNLCQWKPSSPSQHNSVSLSLAHPIPSGLRQESMRFEDSPTSAASSGFAHRPGSSSFRGSSREDSISSSLFGDSESVSTDDIPVVISRKATGDWDDNGGLGIGIPQDEILLSSSDPGKPLPQLITQQSAPGQIDFNPGKMVGPTPVPIPRRSLEKLRAKREAIEKKRIEGSIDSADDEDEELGLSGGAERASTVPGAGNTSHNLNHAKQHFRSKSVLPSSKLGIEMMRANSHDSVNVAASEATSTEHGTRVVTTPNREVEMQFPSSTPDVLAPADLHAGGLALSPAPIIQSLDEADDGDTTVIHTPPNPEESAETIVGVDETPRPPTTSGSKQLGVEENDDEQPTPRPPDKTVVPPEYSMSRMI